MSSTVDSNENATVEEKNVADEPDFIKCEDEIVTTTPAAQLAADETKETLEDEQQQQPTVDEATAAVEIINNAIDEALNNLRIVNENNVTESNSQELGVDSEVAVVDTAPSVMATNNNDSSSNNENEQFSLSPSNCDLNNSSSPSIDPCESPESVSLSTSTTNTNEPASSSDVQQQQQLQQQQEQLPTQLLSNETGSNRDSQASPTNSSSYQQASTSSSMSSIFNPKNLDPELSDLLQRKQPRVMPSAPKCAFCDKSVYKAEEVRAANKLYHKLCFKCTSCKKLLQSNILTEHQGDLYCKNCYGKQFGPKGYGYGIGAGTLSTEVASPTSVSATTISSSTSTVVVNGSPSIVNGKPATSLRSTFSTLNQNK